VGYPEGVSTVHATIAELGDRTAGDGVTVRGKELPVDATVAAGRALFASSSVQLVPLLDGDAYAGAVTRDDIAAAGDDEPISAYATRSAPTVIASTPIAEAVAILNADGGRRLVVLGDDRTTYVGLVCLHRDRTKLCIDAECHTP
jgi:predicted transcriptional regulator